MVENTSNFIFKSFSAQFEVFHKNLISVFIFYFDLNFIYFSFFVL
jgi:hypothetical protein